MVRLLLYVALVLPLPLLARMPNRAPHPLTTATATELETAIAVLRQDSRFPTGARIIAAGRADVEKRWTLTAATDTTHGEVAVTYHDMAMNVAYEASVDAAARRVTGVQRVGTVQPMIVQADMDTAAALAFRHPGIVAGLRRRGIPATDSVTCEVWASGVPTSAFATRLVRCIFFMKTNGVNRYDRPIEGLHVLIDVAKRQVLEVHDRTVVPIPSPSVYPAMSAVGAHRRTGKPNRSIVVDRGCVTWKTWRCSPVMQPQEGLVLYGLRWADGLRERPVAWRFGIGEMFVPYGDTSKAWQWRTAFDAGEYGLGTLSRTLAPGVDVPSDAVLMDVAVVDADGVATTISGAVAIYERDGGLGWKHVDVMTNTLAASRSREVVIAFLATVGNYDYMVQYILRDDGSIGVDIGLTGTLLTKGVPDTVYDTDSEQQHAGTLLDRNLLAPLHQHFFCLRMDLDIDGPENTVIETDVWAPPIGSENPFGNAMRMDEWELRYEQEGRTGPKPEKARRWMIVNPAVTTPTGRPRGYCLIPSGTARPFMSSVHHGRKRASFLDHTLWVTRYRAEERYPSGPYPNQGVGNDGLPRYSGNNDAIRNRDVVLWYTLGVTHVPRPEDWPIMPVEHVGVSLHPMGFFDRNPGIGPR